MHCAYYIAKACRVWFSQLIVEYTELIVCMFHISLPLASIYLAQLATAKRTLRTEEKLGNIFNRNTGNDLNDHYP